jgi:acetyl esterase/lipase
MGGAKPPGMKRTIRALLIPFLLVSVAATSTCNGDTTYATAPDPGDADGVPLRLAMEIPQTPPPAGGYPAIVFIHGGGWELGVYTSLQSRLDDAASRGYVAISIAYRKTDKKYPDGTPRTPWPAQIEDAKCAVRWLRANAADYDVNPTAIGATGYSAGGHLAMMLGETDPGDGFEPVYCEHAASDEVQAVVSNFGPADIGGLYDTTTSIGRRWVSILLNQGMPAPADIPDEITATASPIAFVDGDGPPVLQIQGDVDTLVPPQGAQSMDAALDAAGRSHELIMIEGAGHGFSGDDDVFATDQMFDFFDAHL